VPPTKKNAALRQQLQSTVIFAQIKRSNNMKKTKISFSTPYKVIKENMFEKHQETWAEVITAAEKFIGQIEKVKSTENVASLCMKLNDAYSALGYLNTCMDYSVRKVCDDIFDVYNYTLDENEFSHAFYPDFAVNEEKIPGTEDTYFHFILPFAGHRKVVYHPDFNVSMARYFSLGIDDLKRRMQAETRGIKGFNYSFMGFLHHMHPSRNGLKTRYDLDNVETKRIVDAVNRTFIHGDNSERISTYYTAAEISKEEKEWTEMFVCDMRNTAKIIDAVIKPKIGQGT
jgi:DNA-binding XRE family transcriptional regulator